MSQKSVSVGLFCQYTKSLLPIYGLFCLEEDVVEVLEVELPYLALVFEAPEDAHHTVEGAGDREHALSLHVA